MLATIRAFREASNHMTWFLVFAGTVFGLYFWHHYRVQQRDLESASAPTAC